MIDIYGCLCYNKNMHIKIDIHYALFVPEMSLFVSRKYY